MRLLYIFDMGGVMASDCQVVPAILKTLGIAIGDFLDYAGDGFDELQIGKITSAQFWERFSLGYGKPVAEDLWARFFQPELHQEMVDLVIGLKREHRVVCGTNTIAAHYDIHADRGDYRHFERVYASNRIGIAKPDADFYRYILQQEGYTAENSVFIDDRTQNVQAARQVGIKALLFVDVRSLLSLLEKDGPAIE